MQRRFCYFIMLALIGCDQVSIDFFDLGAFRVMALVVDQPEVDGSVNTTVTITPWISDIQAGGRSVALDILACPDPGIALGQDPTCDQSLASTQIVSYADFDTSAWAAQNYTGALPAFNVMIPAGLLVGLSSMQQFNGIDYIVSIVFTVGEDVISGFKRIKVSSNPAPNLNPKMERIDVNGSDTATAEDGAMVTYQIVPGFEAEDFQRFDQDGDLVDATEEYIVTWFVYSGTLSLSRSEPEDKAVFQDDQDNSDIPIIVGVLRDGRGGADVLVR
ncbi:MAG: hypothetical protein R3A45_04895 [Bdellovibrionota bacterium]